jgi:hypothetical protein
MPLIRTERLTKSFGALTAVNEVTLAVEPGSLHSVIGPIRKLIEVRHERERGGATRSGRTAGCSPAPAT